MKNRMAESTNATANDTIATEKRPNCRLSNDNIETEHHNNK